MDNHFSFKEQAAQLVLIPIFPNPSEKDPSPFLVKTSRTTHHLFSVTVSLEVWTKPGPKQFSWSVRPVSRDIVGIDFPFQVLNCLPTDFWLHLLLPSPHSSLEYCWLVYFGSDLITVSSSVYASTDLLRLCLAGFPLTLPTSSIIALGLVRAEVKRKGLPWRNGCIILNGSAVPILQRRVWSWLPSGKPPSIDGRS